MGPGKPRARRGSSVHTPGGSAADHPAPPVGPRRDTAPPPPLAALPAPLPVDAVLPELLAALGARGVAVVQAPPGAGKTTRVPPALLGAAWAAGGRVLVLEPRRIAARGAARRMAHERGERVGETVGLRVRGESRVGPRTRIEVVTEGVLTRLLLGDPALGGGPGERPVAAVVFDEVHERSLPADLGLALALQARELLRPDLRLVAMSATLDGDRFAALLADADGPAPVVASAGRAFPVETVHLGAPRERRRVPAAVADAVRQALAEAAPDPGQGVLAFLPGAAEIRRAADALAGTLPADVRVHPLLGSLPPREQDAAIAPAAPGTRKVVLATSVAETSVTIDGVRAVVDAGLARRPRFSARSGMTRLETVRVSRAEADQRRGRAGRTAPGVAYRLWSRPEDAALDPFATPEILRADLAPLALDLAAWGAAPDELRWLDAPPAAAFAQARELLALLGALDPVSGALTDHGRAMAALPVHPRLAHMLLAARAGGDAALAADVAALLGERDVLRSDGPRAPDADLGLRLDALRQPGEIDRFRGLSVARGALRDARREADRLRRLVGARGRAGSADAGARLLALAYPDRLAQRTGETPREARFRLRTGHQAVLPADDPLAAAPWLAVGALDDRVGAARVFLAAPLTADEVRELAGADLVVEDEVAWDGERVRARRVERVGALILKEGALRDPDPAAVQAALFDGVRDRGLAVLGWSKAAVRLRQRLAFLHHHGDPGGDPGGPSPWPDVSDEALLASLPHWLGPFVPARARSLDALARVDLATALDALVPWDRRRDLDRLAPERLPVASGSHVALGYADPEAPTLAVKLQETFGMTETPRVLGGRVPVVMALLSPARRPVQVTRDLASFWREGYFDVRKDLRGRYPKHPWPEDPTTAEATARTTRRR